MGDNRIFAYIDKGYKLSDEIKNQYTYSLIFIGDEGQIYSPANDTYIGIGHTAYTNTVAYIENAYAYVVDQVGAALNAIISTSVTHNVNQVNGLEKEVTLLSHNTDGNATTLFGSKHGNYINVNDGDRFNDYADNFKQVIASSGEGSISSLTNGINITSYTIWCGSTTYTDNAETLDKIVRNAKELTSLTSSSSDVDSIGTEGTWKIDADLYQKYYANRLVTANAKFLGSYVYFDDERTVDFVKQAIAYNTTFTKYWTNNQVNAFYSEIMGSDYLPVTTNMYDGVDDVDITEQTLYIKLLATTNFETTGSAEHPIHNTINTTSAYLPVKVKFDGTKYITYVTGSTAWDNCEVRLTTITNANDSEHSSSTKTEVININKLGNTAVGASELLKSILLYNNTSTDTSKITVTDSNNIILTNEDVTALFETSSTVPAVAGNYVLYYVNTNKKGNNITVNVKDGIQTIQEIAYILDTITDGAEDGGISLAYNIASNAIDIQNLKNVTYALTHGETSVNGIEVNNLNTTYVPETNARDFKFVHLVADDNIDRKSTYTGKVQLGAFVDLVDTSDVKNKIIANSALSDNSPFVAEDSQFTKDISTYTIQAEGIIDADVLNAYVARSYDLLVHTIVAAETNVGAYIYQVLDGIDYNSTYAMNVYGNYAKTDTHIIYTAGSVLDSGTRPGSLEFNLDATTINSDGTPKGYYIKKVTQVNGYVFAYYDKFNTSNRFYTYYKDGTYVNNETYNYVKLFVEGDTTNISTYTAPIEQVTAYGFLADALSVKSYIASTLAWVNLSDFGKANTTLDAAYRKFNSADTTNLTYVTADGGKTISPVYGSKINAETTYVFTPSTENGTYVSKLYK